MDSSDWMKIFKYGCTLVTVHFEVSSLAKILRVKKINKNGL